MKKSEEFPALLTHLIGIGEKTGRLEIMLDKVASSYESEIDSLIGGVTKLIEPILILFLVIIIGGILYSVLVPMIEMSV